MQEQASRQAEKRVCRVLGVERLRRLTKDGCKNEARRRMGVSEQAIYFTRTTVLWDLLGVLCPSLAIGSNPLAAVYAPIPDDDRRSMDRSQVVLKDTYKVRRRNGDPGSIRLQGLENPSYGMEYRLILRI